MVRFSSVSEERIKDLASYLVLNLSKDEAEKVADRLDKLSGIYSRLGDIDTEIDDPRADLFEETPHKPDEDDHNAWISRFQLVNPDSDGELSGLDIGIKDNICVRGAEMTCGSLAFEEFVPHRHAEVVERILDAGGRITGKTNMDELAFAPTGETSAFGPTTNPVDSQHISGGSSSGSAAAVGAGEVDLALGSDTGGSVRIPASYCGIVGIKPTYGVVPRYGFAPLAYSMDHIGTLARDVETAALGLDVISNPSGDTPYATDLGVDPSSVTVGIAERFFQDYVSEEVEETVRNAISELEDKGADIREVGIPALEHSRQVWWGIAPIEFAATYLTNSVGLWRRTRVEPSLAKAVARIRRSSSRDLGQNVKEMLSLGAYLLRDLDGYHYVRAQNLRLELTRQFDSALDEVDVLAAPSTPTTALKLGGFERGVTPPVNWNTHPTNITGHPSISLKCGSIDGLPVGLQLIGSWYDEKKLLDVAYRYEQNVRG
ncbi:MAG: amidase family protein [Halobacteria archaeon]|nr:amidase family protein [Halobacteria archaeon]